MVERYASFLNCRILSTLLFTWGSPLEQIQEGCRLGSLLSQNLRRNLHRGSANIYPLPAKFA